MTDEELSAKLLRFAQEIRHSVCEQAAQVCEGMIITGRAWNENQALAAEVLFAAAKNIRALAAEYEPDADAGEGRG